MNSRITATLAAAAITVAGCTSGGLSARERGNNTQARYLNSMYANAPRANAKGGDLLAGLAATEPAARRPFAGPAVLAVAQVGETSAPKEMLDKLRAEPTLFSRVESLPAVSDDDAYTTYRGGDAAAESTRRKVDALRNVASAVGADYLLLMGGTVDSSRGSTALSILNITIVGMFIVPSERAQATMKASGALIDVRTGQLVSLRSAELTREKLLPLASAESDGIRILGEMRNEVSGELAKQIADACRNDAIVSAAAARR